MAHVSSNARRSRRRRQVPSAWSPDGAVYSKCPPGKSLLASADSAASAAARSRSQECADPHTDVYSKCPPGKPLPASFVSAARTRFRGLEMEDLRHGHRLPFRAPSPPPRVPSHHPKYAPLRRRAARPSPLPADPVESRSPLETDEILHLRKRLHELELQGDELIPREKQLKESVELLHREIRQKQLALVHWERRSTLQWGVIPFVAAIQKANRYFDFKKAAKDKYKEEFNTMKNLQPLNFANVLRADEELNLEFNKFGDLEFQNAARAICYELREEKLAKQAEEDLEDVHTGRFKKREDPELNHPIYNLVLRAREQSIVMDQNPVVELERIMKSIPSLYDVCFRLTVPPEDYLTAIKEANDSYSEFWSKYVKAPSGAEPSVSSVVNAEDEDCIYPSPGTYPSSVHLMQELEAVDIRLSKQLVEKQSWDVKCQKVFNEIRQTRIALRESERRSALPYAVIPFVAEIEKANRYFEFKKAVKEKYRLEFSTKPYLLPFKIADILCVDDELNSKFNKFGDLEIRLASLAIYYELGDEIRLKQKVTYTGDLQNRGFKKREDMALGRLVYNLVFQGRGQCGVMDKDPIVELERIMKSNSALYDACFDMSRKPVDGLETAVAAARLEYSQIWSKYFNAPKGQKGGTGKTTAGKKTILLRERESISTRPCVGSR